MTALDRRQDPRNKVLDRIVLGVSSTAELIVDRDHPFFFDHPLDHVPGLLLLEGAVQLAQEHAEQPSFVSAVNARFEKFALFDREITLTARPRAGSGRKRIDVALTQGDITRAHVSVDLSPFENDVPFPGHRDLSQAIPACRGEFLNKVNADNVLIGEPKIDAGEITAEILPSSGACLLADSLCTVHPLFLLECFMQVQRYLNAKDPAPGRIRDILTGVHIAQERPVRDISAPMQVIGRSQFAPTPGGRATRTAALTVAGIPFAECGLITARTGMLRKSA